MAGISETRNQLNTKRFEKEEARMNLFLSNERLKQVQTSLETLSRTNNTANKKKKQKLLEEEVSLKGSIKKLDANYKTKITEEFDLFKEFAPLSDPRQSIGIMNDGYPFLLMPMRIETRFKTIEYKERKLKQLWVRIYPDDCAIDTFEPVPSKSEIKTTRFFWSAWWQSGGIEDQQRGAWRTLVANFGSGRASWLKENYLPLNAGEELKKDDSNDIILVIPTDLKPSQSEQEILLKYWQNVWLANDDAVKLEAVWNDLVAEFGIEKAKSAIEIFKPENINSSPTAPLTRADVKLQATFLFFPSEEVLKSKQQSWTQSPKVNVMPDRFVLIGYNGGKQVMEHMGSAIPSPLIVGPDPSAKEGDALKADGENIQVGDDMKWMVDFEHAVLNGMGFKITLNDQFENGFDRLIALGIRLSADHIKGKELLDELFIHHKHSRKGLSILPQGSVTNNTETEGAGYTWHDDADKSYDLLQKGTLFNFETDPLNQKDGQHVAQALGLDMSVWQNVMHADNTDQIEAKAMNKALWPATMGYFMESMLQPVFTDNDLDNTRNFFNYFVSGRGNIPALKIGKQPYGIYATSAFSKLGWLQRGRNIGLSPLVGASKSFSSFMTKLYLILRKIDQDWDNQYKKITYVGKEGEDSHQIILDVLGLNPDSVEFHQRYAESFEELVNRLNLFGLGEDFWKLVVNGFLVQPAKDLLTSFGFKGTEDADIIHKFFLKSQNLLKGPLIDDQVLSETNPIRNYTKGANPVNYIQWLIDAAETSHDALRKQNDFIDDKAPNALLYLMLQHALDLNYVNVSLKLHLDKQVMTPQQVRAAKVESPFMHVQENTQVSESKYNFLYKADAQITGQANLKIGDYIPKIINTEVATAYLKEQIEALEKLKNSTTADLERAFVEHIDTVTYRLDAWKNGILNYQLTYMRKADEGINYKEGIHIGAYGILEEVRPENKVLTPKILTGDLQQKFNADGQLMEDTSNGGYIAAPSLNHAVTASILRNAYIENANNSEAEPFSVNISSERSRKAMSIIEGIRAGQSLGALLGYQLERALHDGHPGLELDYYIYQLRKAFPLRANRNTDTKNDDATIQAVEARNVVDGLRLVNHVQNLAQAQQTYPFGKSIEDVPSQNLRNAINQEVQNIINLNDAIADVAMAESVHQVVQGNYDRGAATLNTYSKGTFPPEPDVTKTPRSGINITQRVGIHFESGLNHLVSPNAIPMTERASAEPAINKWLDDILPNANDVVVKTSYFDVADDTVKVKIVSQTQLGLQPLDLLYLLDMDMQQSMAQLDDIILQHLIEDATLNIRPDAEVKILYTESVPDKITLFELSALLKSQKFLVLNSRPLIAEDISGPTEEKEDVPVSELFIDLQRIQVNVNGLNAFLNDTAGNTNLNSLVDFIDILTPVLADTEVNKAQILSYCNTWADRLIGVYKLINKFGISGAGMGSIHDQKKGIYKQILTKAAEIVQKWEDKKSNYNTRITEYTNLPVTATEDERIAILVKAEREILTHATIPIPALASNYKNDLDAAFVNFETKLNAFKSIGTATTKSISELYANISAIFPVDDFDYEPASLEAIEKQIIVFATDMLQKSGLLKTNIELRITKAYQFINSYNTSADNKEKVDALSKAAKVIFGDDFVIIPEFTVPEQYSDEWENSYLAKADLLDYNINTQNIDFPLDDWLYGISRVREKMQHWENINVLNEAFGGNELDLHPVQLPYIEKDNWLGLTYPENYVIDKDKMLYTAYYSSAFDKSKQQCGILVDEWTELIPSKDETAGVAFHYDRPNSEPPQVMLLAMPTDFRGEWQWQDLVDTINETLDMAKKRAIDPDLVDNTTYARFLPATVSSVTVHPITAMLNYSFNNLVYELLDTDN